jgi:putative transcriptional regulator
MEKIIRSCSEALIHAQEHSPRGGNKIPSVNPDRIRTLRRELNLSQQKFADVYGLDINCLKSWELGRRSPDRTSAILLTLIIHAPHQMAELIQKCSLENRVLESV